MATLNMPGIVSPDPPDTPHDANEPHGAIQLRDNTSTTTQEKTPVQRSTADSNAPGAGPAIAGTGPSLTPLRARGQSLRQEWANRKYRHYQESNYASTEEEPPGGVSGDERPTDSSADEGSHPSARATGRRTGRLRDKIPFYSKPKPIAPQKLDSVIDILYENQRGINFFCGVPLYSGNVLFQLDPAPWQTGSFEDSLVDITNAQLPDPTWAWAWKRWYVDMSHDVDEQGWEYSLGFGTSFSWHGTHPMFHSFVRRRRWLRKRVKIGTHSSMHIDEAHHLRGDYFTIHPAMRSPSVENSRDRNSMRNSWPVAASRADPGDPEADDSDDGDITNITALIKTLKRTTIDRKKLDALRTFLTQGGDETYFLPAAMPHIMALFMYPTSRMRAVQELQMALDILESGNSAPQDGDGGTSGTDTGLSDKSKQIEGLRGAIAVVKHAVNEHEQFWGDLGAQDSQKHIMGESDSSDAPQPTPSSPGVADEIKGIPKGAGLEEIPGLGKAKQEMRTSLEGPERKSLDEDEYPKGPDWIEKGKWRREETGSSALAETERRFNEGDGQAKPRQAVPSSTYATAEETMD